MWPVTWRLKKTCSVLWIPPSPTSASSTYWWVDAAIKLNQSISTATYWDRYRWNIDPPLIDQRIDIDSTSIWFVCYQGTVCKLLCKLGGYAADNMVPHDSITVILCRIINRIICVYYWGRWNQINGLTQMALFWLFCYLIRVAIHVSIPAYANIETDSKRCYRHRFDSVSILTNVYTWA